MRRAQPRACLCYGDAAERGYHLWQPKRHTAREHLDCRKATDNTPRFRRHANRTRTTTRPVLRYSKAAH